MWEQLHCKRKERKKKIRPAVDSLPHSSSRSLFFLSFFVSLFFQLHTWHSLALIRTTPHWLALDHTSVNILFYVLPPLTRLCPMNSDTPPSPPTLLFYFSSSYLYSSLSKGGGSGGGVYWTNKPETMWSNQSQLSLPLPPLSCKVCTTADSSLAELSVSCSHSTAFISLMIISDNRRDYSETHQPQIYIYAFCTWVLGTTNCSQFIYCI